MGNWVNTVERLLYLHVHKNVADNCWVWTSTTKTGGYGYTSIGGRVYRSHRLFYEHFKGPIPAGLTIDHLCGNVKCVNPDHLEAVTLRENILRRPIKNKTHCKRGHELSGENLLVTSQCKRQCRACFKIRAIKYRLAAANA